MPDIHAVRVPNEAMQLRHATTLPVSDAHDIAMLKVRDEQNLPHEQLSTVAPHFLLLLGSESLAGELCDQNREIIQELAVNSVVYVKPLWFSAQEIGRAYIDGGKRSIGS